MACSSLWRPPVRTSGHAPSLIGLAGRWWAHGHGGLVATPAQGVHRGSYRTDRVGGDPEKNTRLPRQKIQPDFPLRSHQKPRCGLHPAPRQTVPCSPRWLEPTLAASAEIPGKILRQRSTSSGVMATRGTPALADLADNPTRGAAMS